MKSFSAEAMAALRSGEATVSGAVRLGLVEPALFWGGHGPQVIAGEAYVGLGDSGLVSASSGTLGDAEQGASLILSGVDPDVAARVDLEALRGVSAVLRRLIFNGSGSVMLDARVFLRGRIDSASTEETPGGTATITLGVEGAVRGLGRRSERMRSDADQQLIAPGDTGFKRVSYAGSKVIYAGGKPPVRAATAFGGTGPGVIDGTLGRPYTGGGPL